MKNNQKGFIELAVLTIIGVATISTGLWRVWTYHQENQLFRKNIGAGIFQVIQGGTGSSTLAANQILLGNGTTQLGVVDGLGASGEVLTSNGIGAAPTWQTAGGSAADLQDAYNAHGGDAQILTTTGKDIVFFLTNTDSNATVQILSGTNGEGQLQIGTADGSATTTTGIWAGYGGLGIGTTSPGGGLAVSATSTSLSSLTVAGFSKAGVVIATSSLEYRGIATSTWASAGLSVAGGGLASSQGITVSSGDILVTTGKLTLEAGVGTSTIPNLNIDGTLLSFPYLYANDSATSTFEGGLKILGGGIRILAGGLDIQGSDLLLAGSLKISSTGTSTNLGTFQVNAGGTGTSTFSNLSASGNIFGAASIVAGAASTTVDAATSTQAFNCTNANLQTGMLHNDSRVIFVGECKVGQILRFYLDADHGIDAGSDLQIDLDGLADANGEFGSSTIMSREATTTPFYIMQGKLNRCSVEFMGVGTSTQAKATYALFNGCDAFGWN